MLLVGDRVVLRAPSPPEAEYALFEVADIELRASEPGRVREHGYQTTAIRALTRLDQLGVTADFARECALAMRKQIAEAYARGPAARHVARYLGATELLQSDVFDPGALSYHGVFLDLPQLVHALDLPAGGLPAVTLQALYLAALLEAEPPATTVFLSTDTWTKSLKPGERTYRRPLLAAPEEIVAALRRLAESSPQPAIREQLPRADVLAFLRSRADAATDGDARALYQSLERTVSAREKPDRGPLADPELWAIEARIDANDLAGIMFAVEDVERTHGRTPGTTYVRARAALALRLEPPRRVAERVSSLALSMTSFQEMGLLAAEAWLEAGDARRSVPYARDLVEAPGLDEGLFLRAQRLLARAVGAAPEAAHGSATRPDSLPAGPMEPSHPPPPPRPSVPPLYAPEVFAPQSFPPARSRVPTQKGAGIPTGGPLPPVPPPPPLPSAPSPPPPASWSAAPSQRQKPAAAAIVSPSAFPPPLDLELTPPPQASPVASFTLDLPGPESETPPRARPYSRPPPSPSQPSSPPRSEAPAATASVPPPRRSSLSGLRRGGVVETRPPPRHDPRAEPESSGRLAVEASPSTPRLPRVSTPPRAPGKVLSPLPSRPEPTGPRQTMRLSTSPPPPHAALPSPSQAPGAESAFMRGAWLPPYKTERPAPLLSTVPLLRRSGGSGDDLAEHLMLPPGVGSGSLAADALPRSVLEARVHFTMLARELGLDYRLRRGVVLRADESGIEAMQSVLLESFPDRAARTPAEGHELRRHGALLGEILARRLDAEWIDITADDPGDWAMIVPPDTRVWPFGRVARFVAQGHRERDLVSYYLELKSRARPR